MSSFQIIVGSMLGGTEYVAEACEETLNELGHNVKVHLNPDFKTIVDQTFSGKNNLNLQEKSIWLICTSTHGAGDYPDNIKEFVSDLDHCSQDLSTVSLLTIGVGDSSYDTYCKAAKNILNTLKLKGCNELQQIKTIDMSLNIDPEELACQWLSANNDLF